MTLYLSTADWFCLSFLSQLNLSENQLCGIDALGRGMFTAEGITALSEALKVTPSLTEVRWTPAHWRTPCIELTP